LENVTLAVKGDVLTITVDLSRQGELSKTGKTRLVATTHGSVQVDYPKRRIAVALNVMGPV
jgi:hypothetical protein